MGMLAGTQTCRGDGARGRGLHLAHGGHGSDGSAGVLAVQVVEVLLRLVLTGVRVGEVDVGRRLREVALGFDQAGLEVDDVLAEGVILSLDGLEVVLERVQLAHLLLELLDVALLALAKGAL